MHAGPTLLRRRMRLPRAYGWIVTRVGDDAIATSDDAELRVTGDPKRRELVELRFALTRPVAQQSFTLSHSTLDVGPGAAAVWHFEPTIPSAE